MGSAHVAVIEGVVRSLRKRENLVPFLGESYVTNLKLAVVGKRFPTSATIWGVWSCEAFGKPSNPLLLLAIWWTMSCP